jgi:NAD(P)-dependent dehydrogenase (short-subunit alcohol dehydrogenase family)
MLLTGRHIFVTGAGKRLGRALAESFLKSRVRLTAHYRESADAVRELGALAGKVGSEMVAVAADLGRVDEIRRAVKASETRFGPVDILILSASDFFPTPALQCTEANWDHLLDVNLKGQFFLAQACGERMRPRGGVILMLADVHGEKPLRGFAPYCVSKAGLLMLAKNLAKEWAPEIRVNAISPGPVLPPEHYNESQKVASVENTLLGRWGSPQDIVQAAHFLIENEYITGFNLNVDGGRSLV